jgi:excisionase family DNA binding protein
LWNPCTLEGVQDAEISENSAQNGAPKGSKSPLQQPPVRRAAMSDKVRSGREEVRLLNIKEAARFLSTTDKTLYTKIGRPEIPFIKLGRSVRFDVRDLEALIERVKG